MLFGIVKRFEFAERPSYCGVLSALCFQESLAGCGRRAVLYYGVFFADPVVKRGRVGRVYALIETRNFRIDVLLPVVGLDGAGVGTRRGDACGGSGTS